MVRANQHIELLSQYDLRNHSDFHLVNCIIDTIDLIGVFELKVSLIIEKCVINSLKIHSCWFVNGLILRNNVVVNYIDYQMGGHNESPIILDGNIFKGFLNFFDCQFESSIELRNNVFEKGTNLIGNKGAGFENSFISGWIAENNVGSIEVNEVYM
jgi:hypothetical protein